MDNSDLFKILAAQDAVEALIALGWPVTQPDRMQPRWKIYDELLTTTELLAVASFVAIFPQDNRSRQ